MLPDFELKIEFNKNHSKYYREVIGLCKEFDEFKSGNINVLSAHKDEVYTKWAQFNLIFWKTVDWKGSTLTYNGNTFGCHTDKSRVFYAVQDNRLNHLCKIVGQIKAIRGSYPAKAYENLTHEDLALISN